MYDGSVVDSSVFRNETEKMTRQLAELNQVYSRLLQAMTVNMGYQQPAQPHNLFTSSNRSPHSSRITSRPISNRTDISSRLRIQTTQ